MTPAEYRALIKKGKRSKYRAIRTKVDGIWFASKREAKRYGHLKLREKIGDVYDIELQPVYKLHAYRYGAHPIEIGEYRADFRYVERLAGGNHRRVEDVKGYMNPLSKWKIAHCEAEYGIKVELI